MAAAYRGAHSGGMAYGSRVACMTERDDSLYFDDVEVGDIWRSPGRTITETDVVLFAGMTGDFTPLHVDHEYARQTPFGKPIAHGLLGLSVMAGLSSRCPAMHTAALLRIREWQFVRPIHIGDTVHVETQIAERQPHGRQRGLIVWKRRLVNQHGEAVQEGLLETLVLVSPSRKMVPR
jgi:acyl dehydratase